MPKFIHDQFYGLKNMELATHSINGLLAAIMAPNFEHIHASDNLITWEKQLSFLADKTFIDAFAKHSSAAIEKGIIWRRAVLYWAARHCSYLAGDFVECGVLHGAGAHIIIDALGFAKLDKQYWLYDPFDFKEGDAHEPIEGLDSMLYDKVKQRFSFAQNVRLVRGYIPDSFVLGCPDEIAFMHIDMNNAEAEKAALEHLWNRVVPGGIVILDDYGWVFYSKQKEAADTFFKKNDHLVLELPTGQGLVIKHG